MSWDDGDALLFRSRFLDDSNPKLTNWLPQYSDTLQVVRDALSRASYDEPFELIWKTRNNSVSNAGQGIMGFDRVEALRKPLIQLIQEIAADGSPQNFDAVIAELAQWQASGKLVNVPRLLVARAFATIHPQRYHTIVDSGKQDHVIPWFSEHTGFNSPKGNWAIKAEALTQHLEDSAEFASIELRNIFPWFVFEQMRDASGELPFEAGHTSRVAIGTVVQTAEIRTIRYRQNVLQDRLFALLCNQYGMDCVGTERPTGTGGRADALVRLPGGRYLLYEIKPASCAADAVRQALGQLLEYGYRQGGLDPVKLCVVSDAKLDAGTRDYLKKLETMFNLKIEYMCLDVAL